MRNNSRHYHHLGFTLTEMVVTVLILGILFSIAIPRYARVVESSKADDAAATVKMIGTAHRMYRLDRNGAQVNSGQITNACNSAGCNTAGNDTCNLIGCRYLPAQDWASRPYEFFTQNCGAGSATMVACGRRRTTGAQGTSSPPYNGWGYRMDLNGAVTEFTTVQPGPPPAP